MNDIQLEISNLSHHYGDLSRNGFSLQSINISLYKGELLGLLGPSGCGKTTLLRLIAGFESPCEGTIMFEKQLISSENHQTIAKKTIFETYGVYLTKTSRRMRFVSRK